METILFPEFGEDGEMISVKDAFAAVSSSVEDIIKPYKTHEVDLNSCVGSILATDVYADRPQPPFDRVAMDGIAINEAAISEKRFPIDGIQAAGSPKMILDNNQNCLEVMTGAVLPTNTHLVIPYELVDIIDGVATLKDASASFQVKQNIHQLGTDYQKGELLLAKGKTINSPDIAVLASVGIYKVPVNRYSSVAIISTGDELVPVDTTPEDHQIRMSNCYAIEAELKSFGINSINTYHLNDSEIELKIELEKIINENSLVVLSGGVSMGKFDFVPKILDELGVTKLFHKVKQRPGKPVWFGQKENKCVVMGLPGNPVSCLVSLRKYIIEALVTDQDSVQESAILNDIVEFKKEMALFCPVKLEVKDGQNICTPIKMNGSGDFFSLAKSDGFLELPENKTTYNKGEIFPFYRWGSK